MKPAAAKPAPPRTGAKENIRKASQTLTFTEKHRLNELPDEIENLEAEIGKLADALSDPDLFARSPDSFRRTSEALARRQAQLTAAEEEWLRLEEKAADG